MDNFGATAWDYARARQLHYCMLIIASYIRQQAKDDPETAENGEAHYPGMDDGLSGMTHLQVLTLKMVALRPECSGFKSPPDNGSIK